MYRELIDNLKNLFKESNALSKIDINGNAIEGYFNKNAIKLFCGLFSAIVIIVKQTGFSSNFLDFVTSYLSILIGLFITALIFSFDKFYDVKDEEAKKKIENNRLLKIWDDQAYNYAKKFAFITSQTIAISVFVLFIVTLENLFPTLSQSNVIQSEFVELNSINLQNIGEFTRNLIASIFRFFTIYWLLNVMINTLYIVSGMVDYMIKKNNRIK